MKYLINQKIFSIGDKYTIKDEFGKDQYYVKGKIFALGDKLRIYDNNDIERVYIEQKLFKLLPEYLIYLDGEYTAKIKKEFSLLRPKFKIDSNFGQYSVEGNFLGYDFKIMKNERSCLCKQKFFAIRDSYGVDIADNENDLLILALVIIIDKLFMMIIITIIRRLLLIIRNIDKFILI